MTDQIETAIECTKDQKEETQEEQGEKSSIYPQLIAGFIANLTLFTCGLCFTWTSFVLPKLKEDGRSFHISNDQEGWIISGLPIGACIGPILSAFLLDIIGRKWFLFLTGVPFLVSWIYTYFATSWIDLLVARIIMGVPIGAIFAMLPLYQGEISEARVRGANSTMMMILYNLGFIVMYAVGPRVNISMLTIICAIPTVVFLLTFLWIPESPYHHLRKKNEKSAALSLVWLRAKLDNKKEIEEIREFVQAEERGRYLDLFSVKRNRNALLLILLILGGQQFSGLIAILSYSKTLVNDMNLNIDTDNALVIIGTVCLAASLLSTFIVDKIGRKPLYLLSTYGVTLCHILMGTYFLLSKNGVSFQSISFLPLIIVILYFVFFSIGLAPVPSAVSSEIFSSHMKTWSTMIANIYASLLGIIVAQSYQHIVDSFGYHVLFYFFGAIELVIATASIFLMPETSRKSFSDIENLFK